MPYSTRRGEYYPPNRGPRPVIEILIDGQPWGQIGAQTFRFGNRICRMILSCKQVFQDFLKVNGENPKGFDRIVPPSEWLAAPVTVEGYSQFEGPAGRTIQRPYLKLSCNESQEKGVGLRKTEGLLSVWKDLEDFARDVGTPPFGTPANPRDIFG